MSNAEFIKILRAKEDIQAVLIKYASAQDRKDWEALESLLTEDVHAEYGGIEVVDGRDNMIAQHRRYLEACGSTQHLLGNFCIEIHDHRASSVCYLRAMHAGKGSQAGCIYDLWGEYRDEWRLTAQGWKISQRIEESFHAIGDYTLFFNP